MPNRHNNTSDYRFGYQGSEMDNEQKGDGQSYTTYFRQLDPRVGRWLTIDPKQTAFETPYSSMSNNPIQFNDKLGDTVKYANKRSRKDYENYRKAVNDNISKLDDKIAKFTRKGKTEKLNAAISERAKYAEVNTELDQLEASSDVYRIRTGGSSSNAAGGGNLSFNSTTKEVDVNVNSGVDRVSVGGKEYFLSTTEKLSHELKHAFQFDTGKLDLATNGRGGLAYDQQDEVEAFTRQNLFNGLDISPSAAVSEHYSNLTSTQITTATASYTLSEIEQKQVTMHDRLSGYITSGYNERFNRGRLIEISKKLQLIFSKWF